MDQPMYYFKIAASGDIAVQGRSQRGGAREHVLPSNPKII